MSSSRSKIYGEAGKVVRELLDDPNPERVRYFNANYRHLIGAVLGSMTEQQRERSGLHRSETLSLALAAAGVSGPAEAAPVRRLATPVETAKALNKLRQPEGATIIREPQLYVHGYGRPIRPDNAQRAWRRKTRPADRVEVMRQAPAIQRGEVSSIAHGGEYGQLRTDDNVSVISRHAGKLVSAVTASAPHDVQINWQAQVVDPSPTYTVQYMLLNAGDEYPVPVLVEHRVFGRAQESGGVLGTVGQDTARYRSPGRNFTLEGDTVYAVTDKVVGKLTAGEPIPEDVPFELDDVAVLVLEEDYLAPENTDAVAPAFTTFTLEQEFVVPDVA